MGTDLHLMVEVKHESDDQWRPIANQFNAYDAPRNYGMFAVLADVRNESGRMGSIWQDPHTHTMPDGTEYEVPGYEYDMDDGGHDRLAFIDTPRGVPDDATIQWQAIVAIWQAQRQSIECSWLTPEEILEAPWDQIVIRHGVVLEEEYLQYLKDGVPPETHASHGGGPGVRVVNEIEYATGVRGELGTMVNMRWNAGTVRPMVEGLLHIVNDIQENRPESTQIRFMLLFES